MEIVPSYRLQYLVLIGISLLVFGFVGVLYAFNSQIFQRLIGRINPLVASFIIIVLGFVLLSFLLSKNWFAIYEKENLKGLLQFSALAMLLGIVMSWMDTKIIFPADTNVLFPESLLFYPAIAYFAEILFHVIPLTVLLFVLNSIFPKANFGNIIWICILVVSFIEPVYHSIDMVTSNRYPAWAILYVGFHVFVFNLCQLFVFRKYDFVSMYSFRLAYYLIWHIVWGHLRLQVLF